MNKVIIAVSMGLACSLLFTAGGICGERFTARESIDTEKAKIFLSDLVQEPLDGFEDIFIIESPPWGSEKLLTGAFIKGRIRKAGIEIDGLGDIRVFRAVSDRSVELRRILEKKLIERFAESGYQCEGSSLELELPGFPDLLELPSGDLDLSFRFPLSIAGYRTVSFTVRAADGSFERRFTTGCRFHLLTECAVALKNIGRGAPVMPDDFEWVEKDISGCYEMPVIAREDIEGMITRRYIRKGDILALKSLERIPDVRKGEEIVVELARGNLTVKTVGKALENGHTGDRILVRNEASGKIDKYTVVDKGKVSPGREEKD